MKIDGKNNPEEEKSEPLCVYFPGGKVKVLLKLLLIRTPPRNSARLAKLHRGLFAIKKKKRRRRKKTGSFLPGGDGCKVHQARQQLFERLAGDKLDMTTGRA